MSIVQDTLDQLAEMYVMAHEDQRSNTLTDDQKHELELIQLAFANAWATLHASYCPRLITGNIIGVRLEDPNTQFITLSYQQILQLAEKVKETDEEDKPVHLSTIKGITSAFIISSTDAICGKELFHWPSNFKTI